jgi:hypothetical protein
MGKGTGEWIERRRRGEGWTGGGQENRRGTLEGEE